MGNVCKFVAVVALLLIPSLVLAGGATMTSVSAQQTGPGQVTVSVQVSSTSGTPQGTVQVNVSGSNPFYNSTQRATLDATGHAQVVFNNVPAGTFAVFGVFNPNVTWFSSHAESSVTVN